MGGASLLRWEKVHAYDAPMWLPIPGYEGRYEVSDEGQIKSLSDTYGRVRILRPATTKRGHQQVVLTKDKVRTSTLVHKVVAQVFVGPRPPGLQVRHLDGNPENNRPGNLTYGTNSQNQLDSVRHGTHNMARKTHCKNGHAYSPENTLTIHRSDGRQERRCKNCDRAAQARHRSR